jgi:pimeloyl-ACP methyl ester carboxylesterase
MRFGPPVRFTRGANGKTLAYQVLGDGPVDLVFLVGWPSHVALMWENPAFADFLRGLASFSRLILFDRAGTGMSDRGPTGHVFEDMMDDVRTVMAAVGSERTAFFGCHLGGRLALLFAATHPELATAVVTFGAHPATLRGEDYPWGATTEERARLIETIGSGALETDQVLSNIAPTDAGDPATRRWWATYWHSAASPPESVDEITAMGPVDIRGVLGAVRAPALVLHRSGDRVAAAEASR